MTRKRLGRGLDALLSAAAETSATAETDAASGQASQSELPVDQVVRGRYQPRRIFTQESLDELASSIRTQGLMQPIVVRPRPQGGYELIAGERRWRAAQIAGLTHIPAIVRDVGDEQASAMALIENIQREDLNPLEEASALQRLKEEFELTQQQVADAVGKSRVAVTNLLRLLSLAAPVRELLERGEIEMGHARAMLTLPALDQERLALEVARRQLSVRQTESLVRQRQQGGSREMPGPAPHTQDPDIRRLERELADRLAAPVRITHGPGGKGQLVIGYSTLDELEGILKHMR